MNDLFKQLDSLNLPKADYAITGSGPLYAHGLIPALENDLDIVARNSAWEKAVEYNTPITGREGQDPFLISTPQPSGKILGIFSTNPPPVIWAIPFTSMHLSKTEKT